MRTVALKLLVFIFLFSLLTSCSNDEETEQFPLEQPSNINAEDYDVYSAIINHYNFSNVAIRQKTAIMSIDDYYIDQLSEGNPGFEAEMAYTLSNINQNPLFLGYSFNVAPTVLTLISESQLDYIFNEEDYYGSWFNFYNTFPNTDGLTQLSVVAYNSDNTKALVDVGLICGPLCGNGTLFYLEKLNGVWVIKKTVDTWIS